MDDFYINERKKISLPGTVSILHIGESECLLTQGENDKTPEVSISFALGSRKTATDFFKHNPPTPAETENAIVAIEDEIMPSYRQLSPGTLLFTGDEGILEIARLTGDKSPSGEEITRTDVEITFGRLAAIISGRPASTDILPADNEFAARLLILREIMHHFGFTSIHFI